MAMKTDQIKLPVSVATEIVNKAKDTSTIASLSPSTPQIFSDADYLVFNGKSEAEVVAEGAVKSSYEQTVDSVVAKRFKVQPAADHPQHPGRSGSRTGPRPRLRDLPCDQPQDR